MNIPFLDLQKQYASIKADVDQVIADVIKKVAFIGGSHVDAFERAFANYCGAKYCIGVANGTDALFITLKAFGIGAGDEVIVPANSFIATSEAVTQAGARVVFVDMNPSTFNIAVEQIEEKVTSKTRAIIPVHLYGQPADMDPILEIAKRHNLVVIEDAAQAHGGRYKGRLVGSMGDAACFSFYPGKNLGAYGDAGAIVTSDKAFANKARMFANHGRIDKYNHEIEGVNSRLDGLQAAILNVKLKHLPAWTEARRRNAQLYTKLLSGSGVVTPQELPDVEAVYHLYVIRVNADVRDTLRNFLQEEGIATGIHYPIALPNLLAYRYLNHQPSDFPEATAASGEIISLPMFAELTEAEIRYVCDAVQEFLWRRPALQAGAVEGAVRA
jgi:dTDP-4-amino-4,6-dideoxygalactose transaminase